MVQKNSSNQKVINIIRLIKKRVPGLKIVIKKNYFHESKYLKLNSYKSKNELSYKQVWGQKKTLEKTLDWYFPFFKKRPVYNLCLDDIKNFEKNFK